MTTRSRPRTSLRGLGRTHQVARKLIAPEVATGRVKCCLCSKPIEPGHDWHLDHTADRRGYRGVAHAHCNTSEGARRGNAMRGRKRSRTW